METQMLLEAHAETNGYARGEISYSNLISLAYQNSNRNALETLQRRLLELHGDAFTPPDLLGPQFESMRRNTCLAMEIEESMIEYEDRFINMDNCPVGVDGGDVFVRSLRKIIREHPAHQHSFYSQYLPFDATVDDIAFYLSQESALDSRFDDFISLIQIGLPPVAKMKFSAYNWDEMGDREQARIHSTRFKSVLEEVGVDEQYICENQLVEAIICGNLSALLALRKPLIYRAIGYFAVTEHMFPKRRSQLMKAWKRNNLSAEGIAYNREHRMGDEHHSEGVFWNIIAPCVDSNSAVAKDIYWGAMARLNSSQRYLDAMLQKLQVMNSKEFSQLAKMVGSESTYTKRVVKNPALTESTLGQKHWYLELVAKLYKYTKERRAMRELNELNGDLLQDIGVERADLEDIPYYTGGTELSFQYYTRYQLSSSNSKNTKKIGNNSR